MMTNSSAKSPESLLTLQQGAAHMERVYNARPLHAQTARAL